MHLSGVLGLLALLCLLALLGHLGQSGLLGLLALLGPLGLLDPLGAAVGSTDGPTSEHVVIFAAGWVLHLAVQIVGNKQCGGALWPIFEAWPLDGLQRRPMSLLGAIRAPLSDDAYTRWSRSQIPSHPWSHGRAEQAHT